MTTHRVAVAYRPLRRFAVGGSVLRPAGCGLVLPYAVLHIAEAGGRNLPSPMVAGALVTVATELFAVARLADSITMNRRLVRWLIEMRMDVERS